MKKRLRARGWSDKDISNAEASIRKAEQKKHPHVKIVERSMFWFTISTGVLGSGILSFAMIPVLVAGSALQGCLVAALFGLLLGWMISFFSKSMHWIEKAEHTKIVFVAACTAVVIFSLIAAIVNQFNEFAGIAVRHNPLVVGLVYAFFFLLPFSLLKLLQGCKK